MSHVSNLLWDVCVSQAGGAGHSLSRNVLSRACLVQDRHTADTSFSPQEAYGIIVSSLLACVAAKLYMPAVFAYTGVSPRADSIQHQHICSHWHRQ